MTASESNEIAPVPFVAATPADSFAAADAGKRLARERRRRLLRRLRQLTVAVVLAVLGALLYLALQPKPIAVDVARVARGPLLVAIEETGVTRVKDRFQVSAPVAGMLSRIGREPGDAVAEGDPLAEIAPALSPLLDERARAQAEARLGAALSALDQAKAQATRADAARLQAEQELARVQKLAGSGSMSRKELKDVEFGLRMRLEELASASFASKVAAEEVRSARALLRQGGARSREGHVNVISPVSGRVLRVHQKDAGVVQAGSPLLEVGDPRLLEVVVDLLTTDAVRVNPGTPVQILRWGGEHTLAGRVRRVEPSGFTRASALGVDEQRVNVVIALTEPSERWTELADGYRVEARIVLWQAENVLKVAQGAVFRHGDGWGRSAS